MSGTSDHIVSIHSGDSILVIVDVHFEPDLTLRSLRERLRLIFPHWPCNPGAFGVMAGDFNICELEQGRFNVWNQTFTDGDAGKTAVSMFFPVRLWDCTARLHKEGCYSQWCDTYLSRIDRIFVNLPVAEARDFHSYSHVFENLGERSIPVASPLEVAQSCG